jgi:GNAT superfamily N-acetyltransferase
VRSLGYRTDLIFSVFNGPVIDRGDHLVIRTPSNPTFYWGNFLLFDAPPRDGDFVRWRELFAGEIGMPPDVKHEAYGWDTTQGETGQVGPFLDAGFKLIRSSVLATARLVPPRSSPSGIEVRSLTTQQDWLQALDNQVRCREPEHEEAGYRAFKKRQMASYQSMVASGMGAWFGAFDGGELVADLGIFHDGRLARYQSVETHPDRRRQGIGGTMVYQAGLHALTKFGVDQLVIVADYQSAASRLYRSLAFAPEEQQVGLERAGIGDILKVDTLGGA